jgi:hypothetical protein
MTEAEWLAATDPQGMLTSLRDTGRATDRKLRLFAVACLRSIWDFSPGRQVVQVAEWYIDGLVPEKVFRGSRWPELTAGLLHSLPPAESAASWSSLAEEMRAGAALDRRRSLAWHRAAGRAFRRGATPAEARAAADASVPDTDGWLARRESARHQERLAQCGLLRDIFGPLLFRPLPHLPAYNDPTVQRLAQAAYDDRLMPCGHLDQSRLAVLADALLDAGLPADDQILLHLRGEGPHVRGCHALDAVLGRE